ncbi:MAG: MBL fold metallo-hydrolase [Chloroflexi bacterium]|nr:MBL fold metallo-hydrolase [Chloroflexota bacterium]
MARSIVHITSIGHASFLIETRGKRILCDPWFTPAYFASWVPFPSNEALDRSQIGDVTHLYISHLHRDHFDPSFLRQYVAKDATVILPAYPLPHLEEELRALGFSSFLHTRNDELTDLGDGVRVAVHALVAPTDGPIGDSSLLVDDGEQRVLNLNDARPPDPALLLQHGPLDALLIQFSGAIWYPMVYDFPGKQKEALGKQKRENQLRRALLYVKQLAPRFVVPCAGPPCFLDDDLFYLNDLTNDPANIFPDQTVFLDYLAQNGVEGGRLMIPGSAGDLLPSGFEVTHPLPDAEVRAIFAEKEAYLRAYQARRRPEIAAQRVAWNGPRIELLPTLRERWEPLLAQADRICAGVNGSVLLDVGDEQILVDFKERQVRAWAGEPWLSRFTFERRLVETCVRWGLEDWVNELFLSCRFRASRRGRYNDVVYTFFKCLSPERVQYAEGYFAERQGAQEVWEAAGYRMQRRCPHMKADLTRFGVVENGVLTCRLHGWQFRLDTGECLTSNDCRLAVSPIVAPAEERKAAA